MKQTNLKPLTALPFAKPNKMTDEKDFFSLAKTRP